MLAIFLQQNGLLILQIPAKQTVKNGKVQVKKRYSVTMRDGGRKVVALETSGGFTEQQFGNSDSIGLQK